MLQGIFSCAFGFRSGFRQSGLHPNSRQAFGKRRFAASSGLSHMVTRFFSRSLWRILETLKYRQIGRRFCVFPRLTDARSVCRKSRINAQRVPQESDFLDFSSAVRLGFRR